MKSSTGVYYTALDQLRALAAFLVFSMHFLHGANGYPVAFAGAPIIFPLTVFDDGHTGVALFMTLSGYLFAKLLEGKAISYRAFLWNRAIRLLPLLAIVVTIDAVLRLRSGTSLTLLARWIAYGAIAPTLPNGGWSITAEFHFYILLPLLLLIARRSAWLLMAVVSAAVLLRSGLYWWFGTVQSLAYYTIVGRIDQFVLGMAAFQFSANIKSRNGLMAVLALAFFTFFWALDEYGGTSGMPGAASPLWIVLPTIEGLFYAYLIAWYDTTISPSARGVSGAIAKVGVYSYSLYLLHFFFVFSMARFIDHHLMRLSNFYVALAWATVCFAALIPMAMVSWRLVEEPCLRWRKRYILDPATSQN